MGFLVATEGEFEEVLANGGGVGIYRSLNYLLNRYHSWPQDLSSLEVLATKNGGVMKRGWWRGRGLDEKG